ncbi:hypothetical protein Acsp03_46750 [Actinomadura sp. NBRC 104412]|uniref:beta-propeller domain-containing protein n=1 Tax=Actinomadura sp. NBRC 104412 TaxID=3032203 RepID=UPI0024A47260|nr:beta-propeller domain-containing protein [Actinomadura sp. NBRC 104412]GLZ07209.1 hypothetical protein Acsp03_46750 [Actinomadura sp. NBRC 104412]
MAPLTLAAACSGSDISDPAPDPSPRFVLVSYDDCDQVLADLRAATERQVGPYGLGGGGPVPPGAAEDGARAQGAVPGAFAAGSPQRPPEHSRTNAHEAGADEPDLVKTDGRRIVALARGELLVIDPAGRKVVHRLDLGGRTTPDGAGDARLLLSGDRALVMTRQTHLHRPRLPGRSAPDAIRPGDTPVPSSPRTTLTVIDLSGAPTVIGSLTTSAAYVDARQTGSVARVVVRSAPRIEFPDLPRTPQPEREALERNRRIVRSAPLDAWRPAFEVRGRDGRATTYRTPCGNISRPRDGSGTSMLSILTIDLAKDAGDPAPVSIAAEGQEVYGNGASLYVTDSRVPPLRGRAQRPGSETTRIHKFRLEGAGRPRYVASGSVPGRLLNQYSMSEHDGRLRLATTTSASPGAREPGGAWRSESTVYVLVEGSGRLTVIGKVGGLGKGERVYSVRFIGPTAYVVTFRQIDPLYVIDLRDPSRPTVTGELKITGYSAYLHPIADGRLLGVGQEADTTGRTQGTQVSLFDVSAAPRRVGGYHLPGSSSAAEFEPHAFLYWPRTGLTVLPIASKYTDGKYTTGSEALVLKVSGTTVRRLGTVEHPKGDEGYPSPIRRSLIVGDTLWTVSDDGARATGITALDDRGWLAF